MAKGSAGLTTGDHLLQRATITSIRVQGYKSLVDAKLTVRPLTLLAGANSSGKSSMMQPLLLLKQTIEAPYQTAGALVLLGEHVKATSAKELISKITGATKDLIISFSTWTSMFGESSISLTYKKDYDGFTLKQQEYTPPNASKIK